MPELRYNLITTEWVIFATERAKRPTDFQREIKKDGPLPERAASCPFCPGNESMTPGEVYRIGSGDSWDIRIVPNKFSVLNPVGEKRRQVRGTHMVMNGVGLHDVLIETPRHDLTTALLPPEQVEKIFLAVQARYDEMSEDPRVEMIIPFKNHGEGAGTSLVHPHSQIIGTPIVPAQVRARMDEMRKYHDINGTCIVCDMIGEEERERARVVEDTGAFLVFVPFAALSPFHLWIFPKHHSCCFGMTREAELKDLAHVLRRTLARLYRGLGNPDFNYVIRSCPVREKNLPYFHWYLSIIPRVTRAAGFEMGTGMYINGTLPEESAKFLREVRIP